MKILKKILLGSFIIVASQHVLNAQINLPDSFNESLNQMDIAISIPVEKSYKNKRIKRNDFFTPDHIIKSKKNRVEIQYALIPEKNYPDLVPNVYTAITISNIASNENTKSNIVIHELSDNELLNSFNADWGSIAYFQPKYSISKYKYAKLLSLYRNGKGMIYVLFLFEEEDLEEAERQYFAARFL